MKTTFFIRQGNLVRGGLWAAAFMCLGATGCFSSLNPTDLKCSKNEGCPRNYFCSTTAGTCVPGTPHDDGSPDGTETSPAASIDGSTDLPRGSGGSTSSLDGPIATGGSGGTTSSLDGPVATGGNGGSTSSFDVPMATGGSGGTTSSPDVPMATGGSGATTSSFDVPTATGGSGGSTSKLDAPTATDGIDAQTILPNGSTCTADTQCTNGHCVDGFCCATACTGCNACSNTLTGKDNGTCAPVLSGQAAHNACTDETATNQCGNDGTCDGKSACRKVGTSHTCKAASCSSDGKTFTPTTTCDGNGACTIAIPQDCGGFQCVTAGCPKTCIVNSDCGTGNYCDTSTGKCAATKSPGAPATNGYECTSGVVADGVCCDKACTGCNACTSALNGQASNTTGSCLPVVAGKSAPHSACPSGTECGMDGNCDGNGGCHYPLEGASCGTSSCNSTTSMLTKGTCDSTHACQQSTGACPGLMACASDLTSCKPAPCSVDADCATGNYCASGTCASAAGRSAGCGKAPTTITSGQYNNGLPISITVNGSQRRYILNVPTNYVNTTAYKLILAIHELNGNDVEMYNERYYGLLPLSNNTVIFAAPNGVNGSTPCSGTVSGDTGCGWPAGNNNMELMDAVVKQVTDNFCVETNHIYATGWSYGASMSYEIGCERPLGGPTATATWGVRAIAIYSGAQMSGSCTPSTANPVAYYASHGTRDTVMNYNGGVTLAQNWSNADGCTWQTPTSVTSGAHVCTKMAGCKAGYPVEFCSFNGDHTPFPDSGSSSSSWGPQEVWTFLSQF